MLVAEGVSELLCQGRERARSGVLSTPIVCTTAIARQALVDLGDLAVDPTNLGAIGELFSRLNVRLFLSFREERPKKRVVNRVAGGVVTFGDSPAPVRLYRGPIGRRVLNGKATATGIKPTAAALDLALTTSTAAGMFLPLPHGRVA